jgi:rhodanese-related sulfurtransferase
MSDDPTLSLIDLRDKKDFVSYSLPGAINIPVEKIMDNEYRDIINQNVQTMVFYSNSSELAVKAWMLTKRMGYTNNYILLGGLNNWVETILRPHEPSETASREEFERYNFRKAASAYFGGGSATGEASTSAPKPKAAIKRKKKQAAGGGCD